MSPNSESSGTRKVVAPLGGDREQQPQAPSRLASVTMNGGIPARATRRPLTRPIAPQTTGGDEGDEHSVCRPVCREHAAEREDRPTDRSVRPR